MGSEEYAQAWLPEDDVLRAARARSGEVGVEAVSPLAGATLQMLATVVAARNAVEIGTGTGVSTLWLVRGMRAGGVLTSLDSEPEHHRLARTLLAEAEIPPHRVRLIAGRAQDVVPRLSEASYDLAHLDIPLPAALELLPEALRVLRPGGLLVVSRATAGGRISEDGARDADAVAARSLAKAVREDRGLTPLLLPLAGADGLLLAVRTPAD